jgi:Icc protein
VNMLFAQLSDTHFTTGNLASLPAEGAYEAFTRIQALNPRPEFVVITGDLVDRGTAAEYEAAKAMLRVLDLPVHVVPGNHDHAPQMLETLGREGPYIHASTKEPDRGYYRVDYPGIRLFCCDSSVIGRHDGELGTVQLEWLDSELSRDSDVPAVLTMHHHPIPSGIAVMDRVMLSDAGELADVLLRHKPLTRILVGHLHRSMASMFAGSLVMAASSTYQQVFLDLSSRQVGAFVAEPASVLLHQMGDVHTVTHVVPIRSGPPIGVIGAAAPL